MANGADAAAAALSTTSNFSRCDGVRVVRVVNCFLHVWWPQLIDFLFETYLCKLRTVRTRYQVCMCQVHIRILQQYTCLMYMSTLSNSSTRSNIFLVYLYSSTSSIYVYIVFFFSCTFRWTAEGPSFSTSSVLQYHENVVEGWDEGWWHVHVVVLLVCYMPGTILWYGCLTSCFMHACYGYYCWIKTSQHDIVLHIALTVGPRRFRFPSYSESGRGDTLISPFGLWWCQYEWSIWCQYDQYDVNMINMNDQYDQYDIKRGSF